MWRMWEIFFVEVLFWEVTRSFTEVTQSFTEGFVQVYVLMLTNALFYGCPLRVPPYKKPLRATP